MNAQAPSIPFPIASQYSNRFSFARETPVVAASPTMMTPIQIPAVGYIDYINLDITIDVTGATGLQPDGPFNIISSMNFRNASGINLIPPMDGYRWFLVNKYGGFFTNGDLRDQIGYDETLGQIHFMMRVPFGVDRSEAYGVIPALAANANYQMEISFAALTEVFTGTPTVGSVNVQADAFYFDLPTATDSAGRSQQNQPPALGTTSVITYESQATNPGSQHVQSNNVGNAIRGLIFTLRTNTRARTDADWPELCEFLLDNQPRFAFRRNLWENLMGEWFDLRSDTKDAANGLDTGVYVIPFHALISNVAGDPSNTRAQTLATLNATLMQLRGEVFGPNSATLEIMTNSVNTTDAAMLFGK